MSSKEDSSPTLQKAFDSFAKIAGDKEGKISVDTIKQWLKQAGITGVESGISEENAEKNLPKSATEKDAGMGIEEFKEYVEKLAKDSKMDSKEMMSRLTTAVPSKVQLDEKLDDIKAKLIEKK